MDSIDMKRRASNDRRDGDRRKGFDVNYAGPERRKGDRRTLLDRRQSA